MTKLQRVDIPEAWRFLLHFVFLSLLGSAHFMAYAQTNLSTVSDEEVKGLYLTHCATCHMENRTGGMGPALLPESLARVNGAEVIDVIKNGRKATQMAGFEGVMSSSEMAAMAKWIRTPVVPAPVWSDNDIRASHEVRVKQIKPLNKPVWNADPMNMFVVVEGGDHHVTLLDGDRFEPIHRFASRFALHGGPKFSPDGRFVYFGSRDGWITKYDLWSLEVVAEVRAGLNMRNVAVSADGKWIAAANYLPHTVVLFDSDLNHVKTLQAQTLDAKVSSRVSAVYDAAPRKSFVVALKDAPELWEISYDPKVQPIHDGYVHDYKMGEAISKSGFLNPRRTLLSEPLDDFFFDQSYTHVLGATRPKNQDSGQVSTGQVIHLDVRQKIADLQIAGMPHLGSGITFAWQGKAVMASPNLHDGAIDVIEMGTWKPISTIKIPGPGFFMRSHENSSYAWVDSMMHPHSKDTLSIIDKQTLQVVATVKEPGKTLSHIEFTKDGRFALASIWEMEGALVVFDSRTFKEVKRIPMSKPVGKYNVWNKITRSEGTSH